MAYYNTDIEENLIRNTKDETDYFSDVGQYYTNPAGRKEQRAAKKRADIQATSRFKPEKIEPAGEVWAVCVSSEINLSNLQNAARRRVLTSAQIELKFDNFLSDVFFAHVDIPARSIVRTSTEEYAIDTEFPSEVAASHVFIFKFGAIVTWDLPDSMHKDLMLLLETFFIEPIANKEEDRMNYVWAYQRAIKQDVIHLQSTDAFERLAYSYAFAQSCKLSVFEEKVEETIDRTRAVPENLAKTGKIKAKREEISQRIGELFISRFYINLHTDILDTPDVFWEFDTFADHYTSCRSYLEIPKRVDLMNQRLDIMKDLYDMLNQELTIQHGYKLEWIVIYLIVVEVVIEVVWNILIKDVLKLV